MTGGSSPSRSQFLPYCLSLLVVRSMVPCLPLSPQRWSKNQQSRRSCSHIPLSPWSRQAPLRIPINTASVRWVSSPIPTSQLLSTAPSIHHILAFNGGSHEGSTFPYRPCKSQIRTEVSRNGVLLLHPSRSMISDDQPLLERYHYTLDGTRQGHGGRFSQ
jgi:hypothetical protein